MAKQTGNILRCIADVNLVLGGESWLVWEKENHPATLGQRGVRLSFLNGEQWGAHLHHTQTFSPLLHSYSRKKIKELQVWSALLWLNAGED